MCGIFGIAGAATGGDHSRMAAMSDRLAHRGPDDAALRCSALGSMGVRRLAIVDLAGGRQPVADAGRRIWATINGEIYNFRELRAELTARGHAFSSASDSEVLVHAYAASGDAFVSRLSGMFAFAIFDERNGRVVLGRDRVGKKPLYYTLHAGRLIYASELKALCCDPEISTEIDRAAVWHYFTFRNVPAPLTIFAGLRQLLPGHLAIFEGGRLRTECYWRPAFAGLSTVDETTAADRLVDLLRDAVRARLDASDVEIGAFLSGGLDSSLVVALACERGGAPLKTFALGYAPRVAHKDDARFARAVARRFGTEHFELELSASDVARELVAALAPFDEPFAGAISAFWLARFARTHVKAVLSGDGADELFGSYAAHRAAPARRLGPNQTAGAWRTGFAAFTDAEKRELFAPGAAPQPDSAGLLDAFFAAASPTDVVNATLEVDVGTLLADQVLTYADRLSMAHSLEVRSPFLDHAVIEFAGTLPGRFKVTEHATKRVLKLAARRFLPARVVDRPKEGFVLPLDAWLSGALAQLVHDACSPAALGHGLFRPDSVARYVRNFRAHDSAATYRLWTLLAFQIWYHAVLPGLKNVRVPAREHCA